MFLVRRKPYQQSVTDEIDTDDVLNSDSSVRAELSQSQPVKLQRQEMNKILNELVGQIASANDALREH